ncbi:MAG: hypothetical protein INF41_03330 [Rhodospirillaceae bacterium]|jgi:hypothetical protein|nr:hypothetical protein [Rhodospirillaceae bacterium]
MRLAAGLVTVFSNMIYLWCLEFLIKYNASDIFNIGLPKNQLKKHQKPPQGILFGLSFPPIAPPTY